MDYLISLTSSFIEETQSKWIILILIFSITVLLTVSVSILVTNSITPVKKKLKNISIPNENFHSASESKKLDKTLESIDKYVKPSSVKEQAKTRTSLMHAGFEKERALTTFYAIKAVLAITVGFICIICSQFYPEATTLKIITYSLLAVGSASLLPNFVLKSMANKRIKSMRSAFPDALDLLVVSTEAGLGFQAALQRVASEIEPLSKELSHELQLVCQKSNVGIPMPDTLNQFIVRTGLSELQGLVSVISQSVKLGSSLGDTLREYAKEFRDRRMQKAEEEAAKIGTKMIFPLVVCIWPSFFVVAVGPAALIFIKLFAA
ncbi:type II secretion system F family protein [Photobacterium sp. BZF1]|uniref:type II secretion system F family protein n=1 Tax=Photobacterium sp. BZF1 TaxID=1904457 RepID=UPI001653C9EE|nr:type II secretion system F family protein [Photobacterium sp. BZF1]MBC7002823.1 type II secretion system F family protein [Photobacterium sp. BZF1]